MTDEPIIIVRYDPDDLDQMMAIEVRAFAMPWSRQSYEDLSTLDSIHIWVAKQGSEVVGYMLYQFWGDELELHNITTKPERQHEGIGTMLMEHMLTQAGLIGIRRIYLLVRPSNETARALYGKYGFKVVGVRHKYYRDNAENALLMCWDRDEKDSEE
jgi:ribosomal-protein-alanine N-acetyltransferase